MASFACKTLYIPCEVNSDNLRISLAEKLEIDGKHGYLVDILGPDNAQTALIEENVFFQHGNIRLALKKHYDEWSDEISNYNWIKGNKTPSCPETSLEINHNKKIKKYSRFLVVLTLFLFLSLGIIIGSNPVR